MKEMKKAAFRAADRSTKNDCELFFDGIKLSIEGSDIRIPEMSGNAPDIAVGSAKILVELRGIKASRDSVRSLESAMKYLFYTIGNHED